MAVFSLTSALLFAYALVRFIGLREGVEDLRLSLKRQPRQAMSIAQPAETGNGISSSSADAPIDREAIYSWF